MHYYYCPKCNYTQVLDNIPYGSVGNPRDGWGIPIYHSACPNCGNLDAGCMLLRTNTKEEKEYMKHVIGLYQNIRSKQDNGSIQNTKG